MIYFIICCCHDRGDTTEISPEYSGEIFIKKLTSICFFIYKN